ncbi:Wzz/FepE/Etk N-terminal domain-containing protein [Hydrogenophaga sp.]|uniref:Wzz/FepE/Etk N-terminal domain-containing protein n=1 Tax=Hydrogenophaga sp. TaxID=1904254 RepID=UPI0019CA123C|nr:Wzz/FepE/Etk N-terminal domain-containing protein [Hydrogenophaga sp.]MBD3894142.1 lipopolysaccharide biosynthesis protein [Hydrogenophaga sp.]
MTEQLSKAEPEDDEISLLDLLQTVLDNLRLLVLGPLLVGLLALGYSFTIAPTFTASTLFLPPQQQQNAAASMLQGIGALGGLAGAAAGIKDPNDQYISFLQSRALQDALIERFQLMERYESEFMESARRQLSANARINSGKDGLIRIYVDDKDPAFAAELANAHVQELTLLLGRLAVTEAQQRRLFFANKLSEAAEMLTQSEQALQASGVSIRAIKASPQAVVERLAQLQASITAQEVKVATMRGYLTEAAPDFRQALTTLAALRAQLSNAEKLNPSATQDAGNYLAAYRDFKYHETLFELFAKQYEIARIDESREGALIQVLDAAQTPEHKSNPQKGMIAVLATLASGFALLLFVFVRQALRNAAQDDVSAQKLQRLREAWARALGRRPRTP